MYIEEKLLSINPMSRPGIKLKQIKKLIVHYVNSPSSNAILNRNYFESLKYQDKIYLSAHYIIGLDGEIIRIIPEDEVALHSGNKEVNRISIGIENTYLDDTGKFNTYTYNSLVELLSYLSNKYDLDPTQDIIRHYDVTCKKCPKYYVDYPLEFEKLKNDVKNKNA